MGRINGVPGDVAKDKFQSQRKCIQEARQKKRKNMGVGGCMYLIKINYVQIHSVPLYLRAY